MKSLILTLGVVSLTTTSSFCVSPLCMHLADAAVSLANARSIMDGGEEQSPIQDMITWSNAFNACTGMIVIE
jgi:hypothetical protein